MPTQLRPIEAKSTNLGPQPGYARDGDPGAWLSPGVIVVGTDWLFERSLAILVLQFPQWVIRVVSAMFAVSPL